MIFRSQLVQGHWDTWAYFHDGVYYLYYLITESSPGEGFGVATSTDGVHWRDHGWAIRASEHMVKYLGTGAVWKAPDFDRSGQFLCNYSEHRRDAAGQLTQNILFARSTDLIHWEKLGDEHLFAADDRWYDPYGRWDCIFPLERPGGGYWGIWTATPKDRLGVGLGESDDGVRWRALPPPIVEPGVLEAGAFWRIGDRVHAMFGDYRGKLEMIAYVADDVRGPYCRAATNPILLGGINTYFARFLDTPGGLLVNHHSLCGTRRTTRSGVREDTCAAPLKRAVIDERGTLRWRYWEGNEALKGQAVAPLTQSVAPTLTLLTPPLDLTQGAVAEGSLDLSAKDSPGDLFLQADHHGYSVRVPPEGRVEMALIDPVKEDRKVVHRADRGLALGPRARFRLLARRGMLEFYLDDQFIECWTMGCPEARSLRLGVLGPAGGLGQLRVWQMSLDGEPAGGALENP